MEVKVAVLRGGPSLEHHVSLDSGANVLKSLKNSEYTAVDVVISKTGLWSINDNEALAPEQAIIKLKDISVDIVFIALHGTFGEDGTVQGLLKATNLPFTGSGQSASALCIDKITTKALARYYMIPVAKDLVLSPDERNNKSIYSKILKKINKSDNGPGYPCVVKAPKQGSSFGVFIANTEKEIINGLNDPCFAGENVLFEEYIEGTELTCGIIEDDDEKLIILPVTEIIPKSSSFFDYEAKYTKGATDEITPARIPDKIKDKIQAYTRKAFEITGCSGVGRVDFFLRNKEIFLIEINTLPGLTETSLLPQQAMTVGIDFQALISKIIKAGLRKKLKRGET